MGKASLARHQLDLSGFLLLKQSQCKPSCGSHASEDVLFMQVAAFQCLQPFVGTILAFAILGEEPSLWDLGAVGVIVGLITVAFDRRDQPNSIIHRMRRAFSMKDLNTKERNSSKGDRREGEALL